MEFLKAAIGRFTTIEGETIEVELMGNDEYLPLYISETVAAGSCRTAAATSAWWWYRPPN